MPGCFRVLVTSARLTFAAATTLYGAEAGRGEFRARELRCEYLPNPSGIDAGKPRLGWIVGPPPPRGREQSAYRILVASSRELLRINQGDLWDSGRVMTAQSTWVEYRGRQLNSGQRVYWKVRVWDDTGKAAPWSAPATWSMGLLHPEDWHAQWIGQRQSATSPAAFPWLRKTFTLASKPVRAVAYVNPLGYYELYINGKKVDDHVLSPAVSDYSKRNLYVTHEVADYLVPGKNAVALWLGRGWYVHGHPGVVADGPLVRAQLELYSGDGSVSRVITDETWKVRESPLSPLGRGLAFGDYGGERYDARLELPGWPATDLDDSTWEHAAVFQLPPVAAAAQMVDPNRIVGRITPLRVLPYPAGGWVVDLGRNFTGWFEIQLPPLARGSTVRLEYSDQMEPDKPAPGSLAQGQPRDQSAFPFTFNQRDEVIGDGAAVRFRSRFNYHGFRYVRILGIEGPPALADATGYAIRTDYARAGSFRSSNELFNQIHRMVTRTYEALTLGGYVVDCPTRERLGYGGDAGTSMETGMLNFSVGGLYNRWLANWRDSQEPITGSLPHTAPHYPDQGGGGPMWGGFVVTLPWQMYLQYGDRRALETNYPMIRKWLAYLTSEMQDGLLLDHKSHAMSLQIWNFLGDWLTPSGSFRGNSPPAQLINCAHFLYQLQIASKIAQVLGLAADSSEYNLQAAALAKAIHQRFYNAATQSYTNGDSIQLAFPLLTGVVPAELRSAVLKKLEDTIRVRNQGRLDTGMHGTYFLLKFLMEAGRNDLIYEMTNRTDYPGWGYMLANGATTSWESWTGDSHIHNTMLSIGAWFTQGLGGIRSDGISPGFQHFLVKPAVVGELTSVRAKYRSIHGEIASEWRIANGTFRLKVTVPPGTTATVTVPGEEPVRTTARPSARGDRDFEAGPGIHRFETPLRR